MIAYVYTAELIGSSPDLKDMTIIRQQNKMNLDRYMGQFEGEISDTVITFNSENQFFSNLAFGNALAKDDNNSRFSLDKYYDLKLVRKDGGGSPIKFGDKFISVVLDDCALMNEKDGIVRYKYFRVLVATSNNIDKEQLEKQLIQGILSYKESWQRYGLPYPVSLPHMGMSGTNNTTNMQLHSHLVNLFLSPQVRETTINKFLEENPEVLIRAVGAKKALHEKSLDWIEPFMPEGERSIQPDILVQNSEGFYDIYELKTALLLKKNITKGKRKRRRFIDIVEEGLSQLANYDDYFKSVPNLEYAKVKYGIDVKEPKLCLIVGSMENYSDEKVAQALRKSPHMSVMDFDSLANAFLMASR